MAPIACGDDAPARPLAAAGRASLAAVCDAAGQDPAEAARSFGGVHDDLHEIGDALAEVDRAATAEFLRAKSAVEADLSGDAPGAQLKADLTALIAEIGNALRTLGVDDPACP